MPDTVNNTGSLPSAPPPPPEVKVRTMRSDLESMAASGGGLPRFENVPVSGLSLEKATVGGKRDESSAKSHLATYMVIIAALAIVIGGIYIAYRIFFGS